MMDMTKIQNYSFIKSKTSAIQNLSLVMTKIKKLNLRKNSCKRNSKRGFDSDSL